MTIVVAPTGVCIPPPPAVGIFWRINGILIVDSSKLDEAESYGDCITHAAGHYERWQDWQALGATRLGAMGYPPSIVSSEYDEWPRGRVVYQTSEKRFVLYADRRLQKPAIIDALKATFGLAQAKVVVGSDSHYR